MSISTKAVLDKSMSPIKSAKYYGKTVIENRLPNFELSDVKSVGYCHLRLLPKNPIDTFTEDSPFCKAGWGISGWDIAIPDYLITDDNLLVSIGTLSAGSYVIKAERSFLSDAISFDVYTGDKVIASAGSTENELRLEFTLSAESEVKVKAIAYKFATGRTGGCALRGLTITSAEDEPESFELPEYIEMPYNMLGIPVNNGNSLATYVSSVDKKSYIADSCEYDGTNSHMYRRVAGEVISDATAFEFVETKDDKSYVVKCKICGMKDVSAADYDSILCNALPTDYVDDDHEFKECVQALGKYVYIRINKERLPDNPTIRDVQKLFRFKFMMVYFPRQDVKITDLSIHLFHAAFSSFNTFKNGTVIETDEDTCNGVPFEFEVTV